MSAIKSLVTGGSCANVTPGGRGNALQQLSHAVRSPYRHDDFRASPTSVHEVNGQVTNTNGSNQVFLSDEQLLHEFQIQEQVHAANAHRSHSMSPMHAVNDRRGLMSSAPPPIWLSEFHQPLPQANTMNRHAVSQSQTHVFHSSSSTSTSTTTHAAPRWASEFSDASSSRQAPSAVMDGSLSVAAMHQQQQQHGASLDGLLQQLSSGTLHVQQGAALASVHSEAYLDRMASRVAAGGEQQQQHSSEEQQLLDEWVQQFRSGKLDAQRDSEQQQWSDEFAHSGNGEWLQQFRERSDTFTERFSAYECDTVLDHSGGRSAAALLAEGKQHFISGRLSSALASLEACVQVDAGCTEAWSLLGHTHAENDKDDKAISALMRAVASDPSDLNALIALGTSCTNDFHKEEALNLLETWIEQHPLYCTLITTEQQPQQQQQQANNDTRSGLDLWASQFEHHQRVTKLFLRAAELRNDDANVHCALGLLYNLSFEYELAAASFRAALRTRPHDHLLWNKLGATLANGNRSDESVGSYMRALELRPSYVRARANLGIAYLSMARYNQAARHFVEALRLHPQAEHIWANLEMACRLLNREDLVQKATIRNIQAFNKEFPSDESL